MSYEKKEVKITRYFCTCERCFHMWVTHTNYDLPKVCPKCKTKEWDTIK